MLHYNTQAISHALFSQQLQGGRVCGLGAEVKKKNSNLQSVSSLLKDSFCYWQKWINTLQGRGTIKKIAEE